jgi:hypothetical protein
MLMHVNNYIKHTPYLTIIIRKKVSHIGMYSSGPSNFVMGGGRKFFLCLHGILINHLLQLIKNSPQWWWVTCGQGNIGWKVLLMSSNGGGTSLHPILPLANIPNPQGNVLANPTNMITPLIDPTPCAKC